MRPSPLPTNSIDTVISCATFTADPQQGGETGLAELLRVTRPGGKIVLIWPRPDAYPWLADHGFQYQAVPIAGAMQVRFRSLPSAIRVARWFYAHNAALWHWLYQTHQPTIPFRVLDMNPPRDYCWRAVDQ